MKANATVPVQRNTVRNKTNTKTRTTGKNHAKKNTESPFAQTTAYLPEQQIALDSIVPNDFNPRRNFSEQSLRELADNMTRIGLIHAVTLRPRSDGQEGYSLICGERRFRAAQLAGWDTIRAKICPMSDAEAEDFDFADVEHLGKITTDTTYGRKQIESVLKLDLVDTEAIRAANFRVAIDCVNSVGGLVLPELLTALGVTQLFKLHCAPHGNFSHNPEPLPENLTEISELMTSAKADVGFVVDPDVDRLAIVCENGEMFGEEYTLVAVSDYVLSHTPGNTVSNLSSSRALRDVTHRYPGCEYAAAAVGEVNVVAKMKETNAIIGGEGNGGVIYPASHYGRDALVGIALFLTHLAKKKMKTSELRASYPPYFISKQKVQLTPEINVDAILNKVKERFAQYDITDIDGVKIDFPDKWVHLRKSNTEPIIRIYSEAHTMEEAEKLGGEMIKIIREMC